jgi:hypothetical protein
MAYFNHAFHKVFLGTGNGTTNLPTGLTAGNMSGGFINIDGVPTSALSNPGVGAGYFGVFNADTYLSMASPFTSVAVQTFPNAGNSPANAANAITCCPFIIASSPIFQNDKIGPYAGGYRESNKSKMINPKYVRQFYYVAPCTPQQAVVSIGTTPGTLAGGTWGTDTACDALAAGDINANNFQGGTGCTGCCKEYLCGETYYLRIDIKGSPALRFLNHQAYQTVSAYTGCCSGPAPTVVDPTIVYIEWAKAIYINPYIKDLVLPVVFDYAGNPWYAPGTTVDPIFGGTIPTHLPAAGGPAIPNTWDTYAASEEAADWTDAASCSAGMRLFGAYVETKFGNCTFQVTDFFEKEPVKILASMVDYTGDPCTFEGVCVYTECYGVQGMGFGEQVLRDLIVSESYLQNYVGSGMDFRIREITQGYDIINAVNRSAFYGRYYLLHSVPRYNNPTGVFDNDQYMLEIVINDTPSPSPTGNVAFENTILGLLGNCAGCISGVDYYECENCEVIENIPPAPPIL